MKTYGTKSGYYIPAIDKFVENTNRACWAGIGNPTFIGKPSHSNSFNTAKNETYIITYNKSNVFNAESLKNLVENQKKSSTVFVFDANTEVEFCIFDFIEKETEEYIDVLIKNINKVTPCSIKTNNFGIQYISYKPLETYDQNLVLLNFIRNLWYEQIPKYSVTFFEHLKKRTFKDGLTRLCKANYLALKELNHTGSHNHSNCVDYRSIRNEGLIKTEELLKYKGKSVLEFFKLKTI